MAIIGGWMADALNGEVHPAIQKALQQILLDLQRLQEIVRTLRESPSKPALAAVAKPSALSPCWPSATFDDPTAEELNQQGWEIAERLNRKLRRIRYHHTVFTLRYGNLDVAIDPVYRNESQRNLGLFAEELIRYMRTGGLWRLRQCKSCQKWLFAMAQHQQFCSAACRMRYIANSDDFREKRARYMRENYRPKVKQLEERARQLVSKRQKRG